MRTPHKGLPHQAADNHGIRGAPMSISESNDISMVILFMIAVGVGFVLFVVLGYAGVFIP